LPALVEASDLGTYVMKFHGAGQGARAGRRGDRLAEAPVRRLPQRSALGALSEALLAVAAVWRGDRSAGLAGAAGPGPGRRARPVPGVASASMDAHDWDARYAANDHVWGLEPNRFVREQCERLPVGDALDVACGEGRNALWLAQLGWHVTGVDFSPVAVGRARRWTMEQPRLVAVRVRWRVADVTTLEPKAATLDLVLASYLHLPAPERDGMLTRLSGALRPGGHWSSSGTTPATWWRACPGPRTRTSSTTPGSSGGC